MIERDGASQLGSELRVAITAADVALLTLLDGHLQVLLMPIHLPPHYLNTFGLPGGILHSEETARAAASRNLQSKAGVSGVYMEQLHAYSDPGRDLRSRSVSIAYMALIPGEEAAKQDIGLCRWQPVNMLPELAFDHKKMAEDAAKRLRARLRYTTIAAHLLPQQFTMAQLQSVYEVVVGRPMDKRNFRKKFAELELLRGVGTYRGVAGRPAELFEFAEPGPIDAEIL